MIDREKVVGFIVAVHTELGKKRIGERKEYAYQVVVDGQLAGEGCERGVSIFGNRNIPGYRIDGDERSAERIGHSLVYSFGHMVLIEGVKSSRRLRDVIAYEIKTGDNVLVHPSDGKCSPAPDSIVEAFRKGVTEKMEYTFQDLPEVAR